MYIINEDDGEKRKNKDEQMKNPTGCVISMSADQMSIT